MNRKECILWLSSLGAGHRTIKNIENYFGDVTDVLNANTDDLKSCGIRSVKKRELILNVDIKKFTEYKDKMAGLGIKYIIIDDIEFPENLRNIPDPPAILYYKGRIKGLSENAIGMVGARKATPVGRSFARNVSKELVLKNVIIVSGMAYGIDTEAHRGAVESKGITIGVLGCGLDINYPTSNKRLKEEVISLGGAIISEFPVGMVALAGNFPQRNRIISGLSKGVIVVEAGIKSGSLITVNYALEQNRDVFAVPGSVMSSVSEGTNKLIKEGAIPVTSAEDILNYYGYALNSIKEKSDTFQNLSNTEQAICKYIQKNQPVLVDEIMGGTNISMDTLLPCITMLEIKGIVSKIANRLILS